MPNSCNAREILVHDSVRLFGLPAGSRFRPPCAASPKGLRHGHLSCSAWPVRCRIDLSFKMTKVKTLIFRTISFLFTPRLKIQVIDRFVTLARLVSQSEPVRRESTNLAIALKSVINTKAWSRAIMAFRTSILAWTDTRERHGISSGGVRITVRFKTQWAYGH